MELKSGQQSWAELDLIRKILSWAELISWASSAHQNYNSNGDDLQNIIFPQFPAERAKCS